MVKLLWLVLLKRVLGRTKKNTQQPIDLTEYLVRCLAERTGLEPATLGVTGRYSNQLNYRSKYCIMRVTA